LTWQTERKDAGVGDCKADGECDTYLFVNEMVDKE
jgi:hypothetical protein